MMYRNAAREGPSHGHINSMHKKTFAKIGRVVPEICLQTDRQTDRRIVHGIRCRC